jgi:hypothetical protein
MVPAGRCVLWLFRFGGNLDDFLGVFVCVYGVLVCLLAQLVSGQVISLAVGGGSGGVGVSRKVVKFCGSIMRALWHGILLGWTDCF